VCSIEDSPLIHFSGIDSLGRASVSDNFSWSCQFVNALLTIRMKMKTYNDLLKLSVRAPRIHIFRFYI
jgi:hypothetical protein